MKLETTIKPRKDGVVRVEFEGNTYEFSKDEQGRLVADIQDERVIQYLFGLSDDFLPFDEADFQKVAAIVGGREPDDDPEPEPEDEPEDEPEPAAPIEENTPPSGRRPRKVK